MWILWLAIACFLVGAVAGYVGLLPWLKGKLPFMNKQG